MSRVPIILDKLAQFGTHPPGAPLKADFSVKPFKKFQTDTYKKLPPLTKERKRANAKYFTRYLQQVLFYGCPTSPLRKSYMNTFYCCHAIEYDAGKEKTTYCKNRWCLPCSRIRTGTYINSYLPQIMKMPSPQFITLSRRNVPGHELKTELNALIKLRALLMAAEKSYRKRNKLGKAQALFKIEVTYNEERQDFHPHFHAIVSNETTASRLVERWMGLDQNSGKVSLLGQNIKPVHSYDAAKELFKYFTKLLTKDKETEKVKIYPAQIMNTIFEAMRRRQVYTNYGLVKPQDTDYTTAPPENLDANFYHFFLWNQNIADWVEDETGELLTGNKPSEKIKSIFQ
jgi:hypothetical protein